MTQELRPAIDEDAIITELAKFIALCEQHGIDFDLLVNAAWFRYAGEPDVDESG